MIANLKNYPEDMTGKKVVVVGGGAVGLDVVEFFAPRGAETTIIEMMPIIGNGLDASSTSSMKECMEKHHVRHDVYKRQIYACASDSPFQRSKLTFRFA